MKLSLTLKPGASVKVVDAAVAAAKKAGAKTVAPLFPNPPLAELARFYTIDVIDVEPKEIVDALTGLDGVEAVEALVTRKRI